jgi:hypothetical protein
MEPEDVDDSAESLMERIWRKVDKSGGEDSCWGWTGYLRKDGYPIVFTNFNDGSNQKMLVHKAIWVETNNRLPEVGMCISHKKGCEKICCNPGHLVEISRSELSWNGRKEKCVRGHVLPEAHEVGGRMVRVCQECNKIRQAEYRKRIENAYERIIDNKR